MKTKLIVLIACFLQVAQIVSGQTPKPYKKIHILFHEILKQPNISRNKIDSIILIDPPKISIGVRKHLDNYLNNNIVVSKPIDIFVISDYNIIPSTPTIGNAFQVTYTISNYGFSRDKEATVNAGIYLNGILQGSIQTNKDISLPNDSTISGAFSFTLSRPGNGYRLKLFLKNQATYGVCCLDHLECCKANDSTEIDFNVSQDYSLSGLWQADDSGTYYISQQGKQFWWAGLSDDRGLQNGLTFCNIFKGTISGDTINGEWADVPRGLSMTSGQMSLKIVFDGAGNPISLQKQSSTPVGFGASHWERNFMPPCGGSLLNLAPIDDLFKTISKNTYYYDYGDATPELEKLRRTLEPIKEPVALYGTLALGSAPDFLPLRNEFPDPHDWAHFEHMELHNYDAESWDPSDIYKGGQIDADIDFNMLVDFDYLPSGFINGMTPDNVGKIKNGVQPEMVMFARPWSGPNGQMPTLLPGWADSNGNSVLINGRPLNGDCEISINKTVSSFFSTLKPKGGDLVRVSGPLVIDIGHDDRHIEIHPVYALDFINPTATWDLSGTWGDKEGFTYYVHRINNLVWIFISRPLRDYSVAAVFEGELTGNTVKGNWATVPFGNAIGGGNISFNVDQSLVNMTISGDSPWDGRVLRKLYDAPF